MSYTNQIRYKVIFHIKMKRSKCEGGNTVITVLGFADKEITVALFDYFNFPPQIG